MSAARRRRRYLRLARYQQRFGPMMPGGLVPAFARAAWSWFSVWPWTPGMPPAAPWRELRRIAGVGPNPNLPDHAHSACPDCGAVNHGNAFCATCVRSWPCSEESKAALLAAIGARSA